jgi:hypothetical protein
MLSARHYLYNALIIIVCLFVQPSLASNDHTNHKGHSDVLLLILKEKIAIQKLQDIFLTSSTEQKTLNLIKQSQTIGHSMELMQEYLAIPESRYPNTDMYHQSLISRGSLLQELAQLLVTYQNQLNKTLEP